MPIDNTDLADVVTLSVSHPREAPSLVGKSFVSPWFTMDADRSEMFEKATYLDSHPHPYGGQTGYGDDLVEGYHLLSMLDYLLNNVLWAEGPWIAWNYGLDHVRFVSVVRRNDPLRLRGTIREVIDRGEQGHLLVVDITGEVKDRERPGFVVVQRMLWTTH
jgi:acyl dehydratase